MAILRWGKPLADGLPLKDLVAKINAWMTGNDHAVVGGDRAHDSIDASLSLTTNVLGSATIANKSAGVVAASYSHAYMETCDTEPGVNYTVVGGTKNMTLAATGETGGKAWRQTGSVRLRFAYPVDFDRTRQYRFRARAKRVSGSGTFSFGVECYDAAGVSLGLVWTCVNAASPNTGSYSEWTGWVQGVGAPSAPSSDATAPSPLPTGTVSVRPVVDLNGVTDVDCLSYDRHDEEAQARTYNALLSPTTTDPTDAARFAAGARTVANAVDEPAHQDDSVSSRVIAPDVSVVGRLENGDGSSFLDLRTTLAPGDVVVQLPGYTADNLGNADFGGIVSAQQFTAPLATFAGAAVVTGSFGVTGTTHLVGNLFVDALAHLNDTHFDSGSQVFELGTVVTFLSGFTASSATISAATVGTLNVTTLNVTGTMALSSLNLSGTLAVGGAATFAGPVTIGASGSLNIIGSFGATSFSTGNLTTSGTFQHIGLQVGFFGGGPASKPTVVGSKGGNAALSSLLAALAALGLITDSST